MLSIILPFYKKLADFEKVLPLNRPRFARPWIEVLLVLDENESEPGVLDLVRQHPDIRFQVLVNDQPHGWQPPCRAINVGIRHATHEQILICSPESLFVTDVPAQAVHAIESVPRGVALGRVGFGTYHQLRTLGAPAAYEATAVLPISPFNFYGSIACRKTEMAQIGGYDESFKGWGCDDDNVRIRLEMNGAQLLGCPEMRLLHLSDAPRGAGPELGIFSELRKCSPQAAVANTASPWGRSFSRLAWPSAPSADSPAAAPVPAPHAFVPLPSRRRCRICGRFERLQATLPFCVRCQPPPAGTTGAAPKILCVMQVRNESRFLPGCLEHLREHVDGFVILDDGSTDDTPALIAQEPKLVQCIRNPSATPHTWHEPENKRRLLQAAKANGAGWVLVCDADERYETLFLRGLRTIVQALDERGFLMLRLSFRELWEKPDHYRIDGIWDKKLRARLIRLPEQISFGHCPEFHGTWVPDALIPYSVQATRHAALYYHLYHLKMIRQEDRVQRRELYRKLDPQTKFQKEGYDYLTETDESFELEAIDPARAYDTNTIPPDLQALLSEPVESSLASGARAPLPAGS